MAPDKAFDLHGLFPTRNANFRLENELIIDCQDKDNGPAEDTYRLTWDIQNVGDLVHLTFT
jgi:hypothetical protein